MKSSFATVSGFFSRLWTGFNDLVDHYGFFMRLGIAVVLAIATVLLVKLIIKLFRKLEEKIRVVGKTFVKPLKIKNYRILESNQIIGLFLWAAMIVRWAAVILTTYLGITGILALFAFTRHLAGTLIGYILEPFKDILLGFLNFIPNLCMIAVTLFVTRYILRLLKMLSLQLERGKLVIPGFYTDWAAPTYSLLRILVLAFTVAIIYPLLPNSGSDAFKGISVFVGILISLGSSSAIGNLIAGLVLTYTRSFKIDDFISLNGVTGHVIEKSGIVTRVKTVKNEYVTFPNTTVLGAAVTNYNTSLELEQGLIIHAEITFGYSTPWRTVHEILIEAAKKTPGTLEAPEPFVNQKALEDFYCRYEINAYTRDVDQLPRLYSDLYKNIQDGFVEKGLSLYAPHFQVNTVKKE